jgi:hypothetical protein
MDDSRVSSLDRQTHLRHLKAFFTALAANGLAINLENVFLQHLLWKSFDTGFRRQNCQNCKLSPPPSGHQATATFSRHGKLLQLFSAQLCTSFETSNRSPEGGTKTLKWTTSAQEAFQNAKCLLAAAVPLPTPRPNAELSLATDASDTHIGGVMQQKSGDHWRPLGFFFFSLIRLFRFSNTLDTVLRYIG